MKKVLIVEDDPNWQRRWAEKLNSKVQIISAYTVETAKKIFARTPDIDAIIMDACVPGSVPTTLNLTVQFRRTFKGPIITASSDETYRQELMEAGCDHESPKEKVVSKVLSLLRLE
jgi:DNA-binding response OmpR family regulator